MSGETLTHNEEETEEFGRRLAGRLSPNDVVYLIGDLGAGKTCLARGLARGLGASPREVASPSFAILHEYAESGGSGGAGAAPEPRILLRHLDLYRLKDLPEELEVLGLPGSVSGSPVVVEWPGQAIARALPPTVEITMEVEPDGARRIRVRSQESGARSQGAPGP